MTVLWVVTGFAVALAVIAWVVARRAAKRLAQLSEIYWELKYQHLELRKRVDRLAGADAPDAPPPSPTPAAPAPKESFVPLASLRR